MTKRPLSITIISWLFIAVGSMWLLDSIVSLFHLTAAQLPADLWTHWILHVSRLAVLLAGVFMLYGRNWARWLLVVWLAFHVIIGLLHTPLKLVVHSLLFAVVGYFLFRRPASAYFRSG